MRQWLAPRCKFTEQKALQLAPHLRHVVAVEGKYGHSQASQADGQQRLSNRAALQQAHGDYGCEELG